MDEIDVFSLITLTRQTPHTSENDIGTNAYVTRRSGPRETEPILPRCLAPPSPPRPRLDVPPRLIRHALRPASRVKPLLGISTTQKAITTGNILVLYILIRLIVPFLFFYTHSYTLFSAHNELRSRSPKEQL